MTLKSATPRGGNSWASQEPICGAVHQENTTTLCPGKSSPNFLDVALDWLTAGVATIPITPSAKSPIVKWQRYTQELPSRDDLVRWFGNGQRLNLAVVCGWHGLTVLDFDRLPDYLRWRLDHPGPSETYTVKTSRGYHVYFVTDDAKSFDLPGVEVRGAGRYVIAPPSIHPSGHVYAAVDPGAPILRVNLTAILPSITQSQNLPSQPNVGQGAGLKQVLAAWPVLELAQSLTSLKSSDGGHGRWWLGLCPFHDDHSPSLWVDTERQRFGCHAPQCIAHKSGDAINLYALAHRVTLQDAIRMMRGER